MSTARSFPTLLVAPALLLALLPFVACMLVLSVYGFSGPSPGEIWWRFLSDPFAWQVIGNTLWLAFRVTMISVLLAWPMAFAIHAIRSPLFRTVVLTILFTPLLMSAIVRAYGWLVLLSRNGLVNALLSQVGIEPMRLVQNDFGATIAMVHVMLPFAVLPILSQVAQLPQDSREAARDLGAHPWQVVTRVTIPLSLPGLIAASEIVFALSVSAFVTPSILGGGRVLTLSRLVYDNIGNLEWGLAAVQSATLLGITTAILVLFRAFGRLFNHGAQQS